MINVSVADFNENPMLYIKNAKVKPFRLLDGNKALAEVKAPKKSLVSFLKNLFTAKKHSIEEETFVGVRNGKRPIAPLKGKIDVKFIGDWEVTPEELFDDIDDLNGSMKNFSKARG